MNHCLRILLATSCLLPSVFGKEAYAFPAFPQASRATTPTVKQAAASLDINRATPAEIAALPGIGPEIARRIVAYRKKHGPFRRVEDLLVIKGIGYKKWRAIRDHIRVGNPRYEW